MTGWADKPDYKFTYSEETKLYTLHLSELSGEFKLKLAGTWDNSLGTNGSELNANVWYYMSSDAGNISVSTPLTDVTLTFDPSSEPKIYAEAQVELVEAPECYLVGTMTNWEDQNPYRFTYSNETKSYTLYMSDLNGEFKLKLGGTWLGIGQTAQINTDTWYSLVGNENILSSLTDVTLTFNPQTKQLIAQPGGEITDWYLAGTNFGPTDYTFTKEENAIYTHSKFTLSVSDLSGNFTIKSPTTNKSFGSNGSPLTIGKWYQAKSGENVSDISINGNASLENAIITFIPSLNAIYVGTKVAQLPWFCAYDTDNKPNGASWKFGNEMNEQEDGTFKFFLDTSTSADANTFFAVFHGISNKNFKDGVRYVPEHGNDQSVTDDGIYGMTIGNDGVWVIKGKNQWTVVVNPETLEISFDEGNTVIEESFVFFKNTPSATGWYWQDVYAYATNGKEKDEVGFEENAPYTDSEPGVKLTRCFINGEEYYYYSAPSAKYSTIVFSSSGNQKTEVLEFHNGYIYTRNGYTYNDEGEIVTNTAPMDQISLEIPCQTTKENEDLVITFNVSKFYKIYYKYTKAETPDTPQNEDLFAAPAREISGYTEAANHEVHLSEDQTPGTLSYYAVVNGDETKPAEYKVTADGTITGVDNIAVSDDANPVYYNLQGVRVANPSNGIFIRVAGGKVSKIAL